MYTIQFNSMYTIRRLSMGEGAMHGGTTHDGGGQNYMEQARKTYFSRWREKCPFFPLVGGINIFDGLGQIRKSGRWGMGSGRWGKTLPLRN